MDTIYNKCAIEANGYVAKESKVLENARNLESGEQRITFGLTVKKGVQRKPWNEMTETEQAEARANTLWFDIYATVPEGTVIEKGKKVNVKGSFNRVKKVKEDRTYYSLTINASELEFIEPKAADADAGEMPVEEDVSETDSASAEEAQTDEKPAASNNGSQRAEGTIDRVRKDGKSFMIGDTWYNLGNNSKIEGVTIEKGSRVSFDFKTNDSNGKTFRNVGTVVKA